jgi:arylsulfatase A-like enzyme
MSSPNILIILADDIGVDAFRIDKINKQVVACVEGLGDSAGPVHLPTFERMLANGVHFEKAWAHPVCTPTRASLWTGLQPWKTGLGYPSSTGADFVPDNTVTGSPIQSFAQAIKAQSNYRCAMFGKWDLGSVKNPVQMGWDYFAGIFGGGLRPVGVKEYGFPPPQNRVGYDRLLAATGSKKPDLCKSVAALLAQKYGEPFLRSNPDLRYYMWHKDVVESNGAVSAKQPPTARKIPYATADQVEDAKQWIAAQVTPWCVALNLITPHDPVHLPPPGTYRPDTISNPANPSVQDMLVAMMESMDYYVGDLLQAIDSQLSNTVVIFVGDNGTQDVDADTGESIDKIIGDDKNSIAIGGVHVPMIIADGGRMKGGAPCYTTTAPCSVVEPVHIIDIYRTALDIAGVVPTTENDSISIAPHLTGVSGIKRTHNFSQMYLEPLLDDDGVTAYSPTVGASASDGTYKLSCSALLGGSAPNTYLVDEQGTKVQKYVYRYQFTRLDPEPGIPGSFIETPIPALVRQGSAFAITDLAYFAKIMALYATLSRERLDSNQTCFPSIIAGAVQMDTKGVIAQGDYMHPGELLNPDQAITSASGRYRFIYQRDANLALYDGARPLWASNTNGRSLGICIMQADGNLVIYDATVQAIWSSNTSHYSGSQLVVQDDGNVVIYRSGGIPVWATNTSQQ